MTAWILQGNVINFSIAAGLNMLYMPGIIKHAYNIGQHMSLPMPIPGTFYGKFHQSLVSKQHYSCYNNKYVHRFIVNLFYCGRSLFIRFKHFEWGILRFTGWHSKCHVIILIKTNLSSFVVTTYLDVCEQHFQSLSVINFLFDCSPMHYYNKYLQNQS